MIQKKFSYKNYDVPSIIVKLEEGCTCDNIQMIIDLQDASHDSGQRIDKKKRWPTEETESLEKLKVALDFFAGVRANGFVRQPCLLQRRGCGW